MLNLFTQVFGAKSFVPVQLPFTQQGEALMTKVIKALIASASHCFGIQLAVHPFLSQSGMRF
jgi:hypothetical protein